MSEFPPTVPPSVPPPPGGGSYTPPPPPPPPGGSGYGAPASGDRTLMLVLSYLWLLSLVPLFTKKDDSDIQWHAKNGFVLAVVMTAVQIVFWILGYFFPVFTCLISFVPCAISVGYLVLTIICIVKAINKERFRLPILTDYAEKLNI